MAKSFVILLSGPPCSGKTTVENALALRLPGTYLVAYDKLKWQLAGFDREKHRHFVQDLVTGFYEVVCKTGVPIILCRYMHSQEEYDHYVKIANQYEYSFHPFELIAPENVLVRRFHERLGRVARGEGRATVTDEKVFREMISHRSYVPAGTPQFDSSLMTAEAIAEAIVKDLDML